MNWTLKDIENLKSGKSLATDANVLNQSIAKFVNLDGVFNVWRQNNTAIYDKKIGQYRAFVGRKGVSDVIGIHNQSGIWFACEGKAGKDKLSNEQIEFLNMVRKAGGFACEARSFDQFYKEYKLFLNRHA